MTQQVTTIRLPDELRQRVDNLVEATGRSMNYHIQRAVEEYIEQQAWQVTRTQKALAQARAGEGITLEEYVDRGIAQGTMTREGYERALDQEMSDMQAESA